MSCTTTTTSAPRIWVFERHDPELRIARESGWSRCDLIWERLMEAANQAFLEGHPRRAGRLFRQAHLLARLGFAAGDPRRATSLAARALMLAHAGRLDRAEVLQRQALQIWRHVQHHIEHMDIRPRARSSLFHLRMEARHRATYHDNLRLRLSRIADETRASLGALTAPVPAHHRHFARWRGEKPSVHDDTRKILAACLLLPDRN